MGPVFAIDRQSLAVYEGSYCWEAFGKGECAGTGSPADLIKENEPPVVSAGSKAILSFSEKPDELHVARVGSMETVETTVEDGKASFVLLEEPGVHVYTATFICFKWELTNGGIR